MICTPEDELHKFHNTIYGNALDNPVTGRGGNVDIIAMTCELAQVAYIAITAVILAKRTIKVSQTEQLDKFFHQHNLHYHLLGHYNNSNLEQLHKMIHLHSS